VFVILSLFMPSPAICGIRLLTFHHQPRILPPSHVALVLEDDTGSGVDRTRHRFVQFRGIYLAALNDDPRVLTHRDGRDGIRLVRHALKPAAHGIGILGNTQSLRKSSTCA